MSKIWPIIQKHWYNLLVVFSWFYLYTFFLARYESLGKAIDGMISVFELLRITVVSDALISVRGFIEQGPWPTVMSAVSILLVICSTWSFVLYFKNPPVGVLRILPAGFYVMSVLLVFDYGQSDVLAFCVSLASLLFISVYMLTNRDELRYTAGGTLFQIYAEVLLFVALPGILAWILLGNLAHKISK